MKQPPTKSDIVKLVESCKTPGAKLAVALAAFSGLDPAQIESLSFRILRVLGNVMPLLYRSDAYP